jgi:murein DD-endopeptidase MepM/ murein hydrolase activator NlpD
MIPKRTVYLILPTSLGFFLALGINLLNFDKQQSAIAQTLPCDAVTTVSPPFPITTVEETNVRPGRSTSSGLVRRLPANRTLYIDVWGYGEVIMDRGYNPPRPDARWYKLQNENGWVASAVVKGDAPNSSPTCSTGQPALSPNPTSSNPLRGFLHPLKGAGNRPTGHINDPVQKYADDIGTGTQIGLPIYAMRSGKVIAVRQNVADMPTWQNGINNDPFTVNYVLIEHDTDVKHQSGQPYRSFYLHIQKNSVSVKVGDRVTTGQLIARSGHNGASSGPHLHVEVNYSKGSGVFQRQTVPYVWDKPFDYNK